jgi:type IV pilus assembly protein PilF
MPNARIIAAPVLASLAVWLGGCASKPPATPAPQVQEQPAVATVQSPPATPRQRAELHTELAAGYYERGQMDIAIEELRESEQIDSSYPRIYNVYGLVYSVLGDTAKAEASFQRALAMAPNDSDIRHNWGWYLCTHGRPAESIAEFEQAIRNPLYKTPEVALINAGKCSAAAGNSEAANAYFRRALQIQPTNAVAAYNLALLEYKGERLAEARGLMRIVMLQTNPPPEALFLGLCIERKLGDRPAEASYSTQLRNRYPGAAETRAITTAGSCG